MRVVCIGDVHGKTKTYQKMLRQKYPNDTTIQLGDMGIGFKGVGLHEMTQNHTWFRGNHDNPEKCRANKNYRGDYGFDADLNLFWIAGASSIDREYRIEGISWWRDEELSQEALYQVIDLYQQVKPEYVISHECPTKANQTLLYSMQGSYFAMKSTLAGSRTCQAMQTMLDIHAPKEWVFGHYHVNKSFTVPTYRTKFTCVSELSVYILGENGGEFDTSNKFNTSE